MTNWDREFVDLKWKAPDDGGAPITEYIVEKRDKAEKPSAWKPCLTVPVRNPASPCLYVSSVWVGDIITRLKFICISNANLKLVENVFVAAGVIAFKFWMASLPVFVTEFHN